MKETFRKQLLIGVGFSQEEITSLDLLSDDETFQETVRKKFQGAMLNNGFRQKTKNVDDIEKHLSEGWGYIAVLPNDKIVVKLP